MPSSNFGGGATSWSAEKRGIPPGARLPRTFLAWSPFDMSGVRRGVISRGRSPSTASSPALRARAPRRGWRRKRRHATPSTRSAVRGSRLRMGRSAEGGAEYPGRGRIELRIPHDGSHHAVGGTNDLGSRFPSARCQITSLAHAGGVHLRLVRRRCRVLGHRELALPVLYRR
jgi:hypothetical protein